MAAAEAPSGAGATPAREPETVTFAARDATSGPDSDLVSRVFLRCAWRHDERSFDVTLVAPGTGAQPPTVWRALNCRQPSNVRFDNWYDRAVGALASLEAGDHFRFEFAPKTKTKTSAGAPGSALPGGVGAFLRAADPADADRAPPPSAVLRWTWHEAPRGTPRDTWNDDATANPPAPTASASASDRRLVGTAELERVSDTNTDAMMSSSPESYAIVVALYGESVRRNETLRSVCRSLERDVAASRSAETLARLELEKFADARAASRSDLATRVSLLLNEKKRRIRELELDLNAAHAQVDALERTAREAQATYAGAKEKEYDDDDDDDDDTEDEAVELEARRARSASRRSGEFETLGTGVTRSPARESSVEGKRKVRLPARAAATTKKRRESAFRDAADVATAGDADLGTEGTLGTQVSLGTQGTLGTQVSLGTQRASGTQRRQTTRKPGRRVIGDDIGDDLNLF